MDSSAPKWAVFIPENPEFQTSGHTRKRVKDSCDQCGVAKVKCGKQKPRSKISRSFSPERGQSKESDLSYFSLQPVQSWSKDPDLDDNIIVDDNSMHEHDFSTDLTDIFDFVGDGLGSYNLDFDLGLDKQLPCGETSTSHDGRNATLSPEIPEEIVNNYAWRSCQMAASTVPSSLEGIINLLETQNQVLPEPPFMSLHSRRTRPAPNINLPKRVTVQGNVLNSSPQHPIKKDYLMLKKY
ncbi:hypothetical protein TruAng_006243 [Truncatella angustata]|nr:hypothetical protein TruAng_006243 [Truncatella angustata]